MGSILGFHPPFPDHMHHSGAGQNNAGATKILEAHHRLEDAFDGTMVLLDNVVRIPDLSDLDGRLPVSIHGLGAAKLAPPLSTVRV
jgi:hypothetical protein